MLVCSLSAATTLPITPREAVTAPTTTAAVPVEPVTRVVPATAEAAAVAAEPSRTLHLDRLPPSSLRLTVLSRSVYIRNRHRARLRRARSSSLADVSGALADGSRFSLRPNDRLYQGRGALPISGSSIVFIWATSSEGILPSLRLLRAYLFCEFRPSLFRGKAQEFRWSRITSGHQRAGDRTERGWPTWRTGAWPGTGSACWWSGWAAGGSRPLAGTASSSMPPSRPTSDCSTPHRCTATSSGCRRAGRRPRPGRHHRQDLNPVPAGERGPPGTR